MKKRCLHFTIVQEGKKLFFAIENSKIEEILKEMSAKRTGAICFSIGEGEKETELKIKVSKFLRAIKEAELNESIIPHNLDRYVTDMTREYSKERHRRITGRESETEKIWFYLSQKTRNNVFLVGDADVGKTTIANEIVRQISVNECPREFYHFRVIRIKIQEITCRSEQWFYPYIISSIEQFLEKNQERIVLYIDNAIEWRTDAGTNEMLYKALIEYNIPVLATERTERFEEYFLNDSVLFKYLNYIYIEEPELEQIEMLLDDHIKYLQKKYEVKISPAMIKFAIFTSALSNTNSANPGRAENVLERAFLEAKRKDKKEVGKENILNCYHSYTKMYNSLSNEEKRKTAFHEAGHYVVTIMCQNVHDEKIAFVSILPMLNFYGVNWMYQIHGGVEYDERYFIDQIAICFGGRVAENRIISKDNTGASQDLEQANDLAEKMVMKYGFGTKNRTYTNSQGYVKGYTISDAKKKELNDLIQEYLDEGEKEAERIIDKNFELVRVIANALLKDEILTGEELEKIVKNYNKSTKKNSE